MADVFGVRVTADLEIIDSLIIIRNTASAQTDPSVVWAGQNYFVTYLDGAFEGRASNVVVQRVSPLGVVLDNGASVGQGEYRPGIDYDGVRCLAVWCQEYAGVKARFVNADGQPEGAVFDVAPLGASSTQPCVRCGAEGYLVVWADFAPGGTDLDVFGRIISFNGTLVTDPLRIAEGPASQASPAIAYNSGAAEFLVVWVEDNERIFGRAISAAGVPTGTPFAVSDSTPHERSYVSAAAADASYLIAWSEFHADNDIYGNTDISTGIDDRTDGKATPTVPVLGRPLTGRLDRTMDLYDVLGRRVMDQDPGPGVYFFADGDGPPGKVIIIR